MLIVGVTGGPVQQGAFTAGEQAVFLVLTIVTSLVSLLPDEARICGLSGREARVSMGP